MDLNDKGRLRNVFWADARSRAACKEFGDVVTFDTTYLVNKYEMPFAPFVGVNHHGLEDMHGGCAPRAIITDQCMAMKNAIQSVFPDTRHRWCIWHIMKKVPEKFGGYKDYDKISWCMRKAVYNSLTVDEFENAWDGFIKKYELQGNTWLEGLHEERKRWVPAYLNDCFWAGMASTQRSEGMNAYFDGYITSRTTLKQFVEQYENALANKVESEQQEDMKSWNTYIPLITKSELEKQFQSVYTNAKVKEFHEQFAVGRLGLSCKATKEDDSEYVVKEWVTFGEGDERQRIQVPFTVAFDVETNETHCNCRLFESRGMVCRHQLMVWNEMGIERVPDKYVLRRWCKNVKRVHTKVRISYDKSSASIEARRHDNMCNLFNEIVDLAEDSQEKYEMVMARVSELKREVMEASVVCDSNVVSLADDTGTRDDPISVGDGVIHSKKSANILDPKVVRRQGRPPCKRKQGFMEKSIKKKVVTKKKTLPKEKAKEVEKNVVGHGVGTQESVANVNGHPSYMGHSLWLNIMPHTIGHGVGTQESVANVNGHPSYMGYSMWPDIVQANMAQGRSVFPCSPALCPTGTSMPQSRPSFRSSQSNMASIFNDHVWRGQSTIADSQVWGGGQSSFLEQSQGERRGGQQSYLEMMNATDND